MKYFSFVCLLGLLASCSTETPKNRSILDYVLIPGGGTNSVREFQSRTDSSQAIMILREYHTKVNDSVQEFNFTWTTNEDIPTYKTVERYGKNTIQFISGAYFEVDSIKRVKEAPLVFSGNTLLGLGQKENQLNYVYAYGSEADSLKMQVKSDWNFSFEAVDSLGAEGKDCLVITSTETVDFQHGEFVTSNGEIKIRSIRIYARDRGLIRFGSFTGEKLKWFRLRDN